MIWWHVPRLYVVVFERHFHPTLTHHTHNNCDSNITKQVRRAVTHAHQEKWFTKKSPKKQKKGLDLTDWVRVHDAIGKRNHDLLNIDELNTEMEKGYVFSEFKTAIPTFNPTFKVLRGKKTSVYLHQRIPAWCDRVRSDSYS